MPSPFLAQEFASTLLMTNLVHHPALPLTSLYHEDNSERMNSRVDQRSHDDDHKVQSRVEDAHLQIGL